jgi:hypothetical protein
MQETVGDHNHPLGAVSTTGSPASPSVEIDPPSPTVEAGVPTPGLSTRSQTRVPVGNTVGREAVDVMEENQGEDPLDGAGLSEQDEALSDGDSFVGNDYQVMGPPNLQELVRLGQEHCRTPCRVRNRDGVQVASICGKRMRTASVMPSNVRKPRTISKPPGLTHGFLSFAVLLDMGWRTEPSIPTPSSMPSRLTKRKKWQPLSKP